MSLERIKKGLAFTRANKKFSNLDKMYFQLKKMERQGIDVPKEKLNKLSMDLGNAAFDLNQADMAIGGDGDYASYDDIGQEGFDQVVERQKTLNEQKTINEISKKYN